MENLPLFVRPKGLKYTDMCIEIDRTFYTPERDDAKCFSYMYLLAYMLASKARYFNNPTDYENYSCFLAQSTFQRMVDPNKIPVKSVLNYMKSIMYFRKVAYLRESFSEVIDPDYNKNWNGDFYIEKELSRLESQNYRLIQFGVNDVLENIAHEIKSNIPKIYKDDKNFYNNLYKSALLSFTSQIVLPRNGGDYIADKQTKSTNFSECEYYNRHLSDEIILWKLPKDMEDTVRLIINKTRVNLVKDIKEIISEFKIGEKELRTLNFNLICPSGDFSEYRD